MSSIDIQERLDQWLLENPAALKYVTKLYYVPEGTTAPDDATHQLLLASTAALERKLTIAAVVTPEVAVLLDMILSMVATQPPAG